MSLRESLLDAFEVGIKLPKIKRRSKSEESLIRMFQNYGHHQKVKQVKSLNENVTSSLSNTIQEIHQIHQDVHEAESNLGNYLFGIHENWLEWLENRNQCYRIASKTGVFQYPDLSQNWQSLPFYSILSHNVVKSGSTCIVYNTGQEPASVMNWM